MANKIYNCMLQAIITAIIVTIGMMVIRHQQPPRIVKVDLVAITTHYTQLMTQNSLSTTQPDNPKIKQIADTIKANLEPLISEYAKDHNVVVIQAQALVDNSTQDITNLIIEQLDKKLK